MVTAIACPEYRISSTRNRYSVTRFWLPAFYCEGSPALAAGEIWKFCLESMHHNFPNYFGNAFREHLIT
jgi:hypothetical protein